MNTVENEVVFVAALDKGTGLSYKKEKRKRGKSNEKNKRNQKMGRY